MAYDEAALIAAIEPHLKPGETLLHSAAGDAGDTSVPLWAVAGFFVFGAVMAGLQSAGVPVPGAVVLVCVLLFVAAFVGGALTSSRPCAIGMTSERILVAASKNRRDLAATFVSFAAPIAELRDINLFATKFGWRLGIDGERRSFEVAVSELDARTAIQDIIGSIRTKLKETRSPAAPATVTTNYANLARLVFVPFGVLAAVALARQGFGLRLNAFFGELIDAYDGTIQAIARLLFEPVIKVALNQLRAWFTLDLQLLPHWKYVFILWWLVFGAIARAVAQVKGQRAAAGYYVWGGVCAFAAGVVAGVAPLPSLGVILCMSGLFFFLIGLQVLDAWTAWPGPKEFVNGMIGAAFLTMGATALGGIFYDPRASTYGLQATATAVGLVALFALYRSYGIAQSKAAEEGGNIWARLSVDPRATASLDVLTVLGGAAVIIFLATLTRG